MNIVINTLLITTFLFFLINIQLNASRPADTSKEINNSRRVQERLTLLPDGTPLHVLIGTHENIVLRAPQNNDVPRPRDRIVLMPDGTPLHVPIRSHGNTALRVPKNYAVPHPQEHSIVLPDTTYLHVHQASQDNAAHRSLKNNDNLHREKNPGSTISKHPRIKEDSQDIPGWFLQVGTHSHIKKDSENVRKKIFQDYSWM
ncbi:uncharacterized protein LOC117180616 [Belonocnema kinseyi]|uniref:uncharacterized protein LOC117180616 n=1 Tax=Belonocnema kinseyi TaxID=2817044 RepID=UPI00143DBA96|nr:uncharacterized protein LOC117180616 [Belonocnema kinseyi]